MPLKDLSWDITELILAAEIEIEPYWLVRSIPDAEATIGSANASSAKIITRLIVGSLPRLFYFLSFHPRSIKYESPSLTTRDSKGSDIVMHLYMIYIDGQVEGTIDPRGNRLTIGPNGRVRANVNACVVVVEGKLEGSIQASERVDLKQSATVVGEVVTQRISIDEGACIQGSVEIQKDAPKKEVLGVTALSSK